MFYLTIELGKLILFALLAILAFPFLLVGLYLVKNLHYDVLTGVLL